MNDTYNIGIEGEEIACQWLRKHGFRIMHRNWRSGHLELDIVARKLGVVHFVEVKTRRAEGLTTPEDALTRDKVSTLLRAANLYVATYKIDEDIQFDLIAVDRFDDSQMEVRFIERAVESRW